MYSWAFFPAPKEQRKFAYTITGNSGMKNILGYDEEDFCIGHLRADFGRSGQEFWATFHDHNPGLKTQEFKDVFDEAINILRRADGEINPLYNRSAMRRCFRDYPEAREEGGWNPSENYIFRMDVFPDTYPKTHSVYSLIMRMNATTGIYNLYCYCYNTRDLEGGVA